MAEGWSWHEVTIINFVNIINNIVNNIVNTIVAIIIVNIIIITTKTSDAMFAMFSMFSGIIGEKSVRRRAKSGARMTAMRRRAESMFFIFSLL